MPGSFDSSAARSSMAPTSERQLEGQIETAGQLSHFSLCELRCFLLGFVHRDENQVFQHLDVLGIGDAWIDLHARLHLLRLFEDLREISHCVKERNEGLVEQLEVELVDCCAKSWVLLAEHANALLPQGFWCHPTTVRILCRRLHCALHFVELPFVRRSGGFGVLFRGQSVWRFQLWRIAWTSRRPLDCSCD